jgi:DNA-binding helix-hairpin-helix protein with protein kinase domain/Tfp pilus assembly protein PilF
MSRIFYISQQEIIRPSRKIGIGGEGQVYEVQGRDDLVVKLYHELPTMEKAEKLVALSRLGTERLLKLSAWPVDVVRDKPDGAVVGFVMNKISQAEEVHALHSPKSRLQKFPEASWAFLLYVAANIARAVAAVHDHGLVIGDVNPKNILVTKQATVYLLDCDSFQVSVDGRTYRCDAGFAEYTAPELQGRPFREADRTEEHDYFGLAVVIFQLLFLGRHPFSGRFLGTGEMALERAIRELRFAYGADAESRQMRQPPGTLPLEAMPAPLVKLFRRAFLSTSLGDRPQPREWIEPLVGLAKSLKKCGLHSGHYFYRELRDCPWCGIEAHARVRLFNFLLAGSDGNRGPFPLDEIWGEIESVPAPITALTPQDNQIRALEPSAEVTTFAHERRTRFILALGFSAAAGLLIPLLTDFPFTFWLLIMAGVGAFRLAKAEKSMTGQTQLLLQRQPAVSDEPLVGRIESVRQEAEDTVRRIEERWEKEAGNARFLAKLDELRTQRNVYADLPRLREQKLKQLEAAAREDQLDEFLDRFEVRKADIFPAIKPALLSNGVETAADVTEQKLHELRQIPTIGPFYAERLSEWRCGLERGFVFEPAKGVSPQARIAVEKEIDAIRFRLEHEISSGPFYLRRVRQEIEENRKELQPALSNARQSLAQAEKDLEVAGRSNSFKPLLAVLLIAFFIGFYLASEVEPVERGAVAERPQPVAQTVYDDHQVAPRAAYDEAVKLYHQGVKLSREGKFKEAVEVFERAVELDPRLNGAYEELGYALYRLGRYEESINASRQAVILTQDFGPYYNLGLAYVAQKQWDSAKTALQYAVTYCDKDEWAESYSQAYYYLGLSLTRLGEAEATIEALENGLRVYPELTVERFELANLYLWVGKRKAAKAQYEILKERDEKLAEELRKLMIKER